MKPEQLGLYVGIGVLVAGIFLLDAWMALGFTPWLLYVIPLGLTYWAIHLYAAFAVAGLCTVLIFVGYALSPPLAPESLALTNRTIGAITLWALSFLVVEYKLLARRLSQLTALLQAELRERTQDLGRAVSTLRVVGGQGGRDERDRPGAGDELKRHVTDVLTAESRRLQEKVEHLELGRLPAPNGEEELEKTRTELERLHKQLEQLQRDLLRP
jgi:hypothetical protein